MKIAGRKNDGAWFRTNKAIKSIQGNEGAKTSFLEAMIASVGAKAGAVVVDLQSLAAECGVSFPLGDTASGTDLLTAFATSGIPRQIWNGKLSFTTYSSTDPVGTPGRKVKANYQSQVHFFAKDLRRFCKYWIQGRRELADLTVTGEVGVDPALKPNATKGS